MYTTLSARLVAIAALATAAFGAASPAHAGGNINFSIDVQGRSGYWEPAPYYVEPRNVYVQPRPVYVQPRPIYIQPRPVYVPAPVYFTPEAAYGRPWRSTYDSGYARERGWRHAEWHRHQRDRDRRGDDWNGSHGHDRD